MKLTKILVPVDGSPLAESAVPTAVALARDSSARVLLLRAAEAHTFPGADPTDAQVEVVREAEEYLAGLVGRLAEQGFTNVDTSVWYGPPGPAIIEAARLTKSDVIIMTTHGRTGLGRLILGSVAESVLRSSPTPILLLRAPGAPVETPRGAARPSTEFTRV